MPSYVITAPDGRIFAEGDQIYLVGFSRGAYTARSLVGMIRKRRATAAR